MVRVKAAITTRKRSSKVHLPQVASIEAEAKALESESDDEPTIIEDLSDEEQYEVLEEGVVEAEPLPTNTDAAAARETHPLSLSCIISEDKAVLDQLFSDALSVALP